MTTTDKKVTRVTTKSYCVLYVSKRKARPIVCTILPNDVLEFREHGRRDRFLLPIEAAFRYAVRCKALADALDKHKKRCAKRGVAFNRSKR